MTALRFRSIAIWIATSAPLALAGACDGDEFEGQASNATGGVGGVIEGGKDVIGFDQGWVQDAPAPDQATPDAEADAVVAPPCQGTSFLLSPALPKAPSFDVTFEHVDGLVCIGFRATCGGGEGKITDLPSPMPCPNKQFCWAANVANCAEGPVHLEFVHLKDVGVAGDYCHDMYTGSSGEVVESCDFALNPAG